MGRARCTCERRVVPQQAPPECDEHGTQHAAVSRRARRQPHSSGRADYGTRASGERRNRVARAQARSAGGDPRCGAPAGRAGVQARHRRRVQPRLLASRFHAQIRQRADDPVEAYGALPLRAERSPAQPALSCRHRQAGAARRRCFRRRLQISRFGRPGDGENHAAVAHRDAFPRRTRSNRRQGLSRARRVLR